MLEARRRLGLLKLLGFLYLFMGMSSVSADSPKVLFINSYHPGYEWSDGVEKGLEDGLTGQGVELQKFYMDSKRKRSTEEIAAAAEAARDLIQSTHPDVVITCDDNAAKHVIQRYFKDSPIPFVFTGVNWDSSIYGFPYRNVTGMEEVSLIKSIAKQLRAYAKGDSIGLISIDAISGRRNAKYFEKQLNRRFDKAFYIKSFAEWKQKIVELQSLVDMVILENPKGISGWDNKSGLTFLQQNTRVPIGTTHVWLAPYALFTIAKIPQEQGRWAARTVLRILQGTKPVDIPIVQNKEGLLYINLKIGQRLGVIFTPELIKTATILR
jgi:hypothetical protein